MQKRKIVLYIAASLDGYIATQEDSLEWLFNVPGEGDNGFSEFYETVDTVIMGNRTLEWVIEHDGQVPYKDKKCYAYSSKKVGSIGHIEYTDRNIKELLLELKGMEGKNIWIVGGSQIIDMVRRQKLIDEYVICIAPVVLGGGIPLFCEGEIEPLVFEGTKTYGSIVELRYKRA